MKAALGTRIPHKSHSLLPERLPRHAPEAKLALLQDLRDFDMKTLRLSVRS